MTTSLFANMFATTVDEDDLAKCRYAQAVTNLQTIEDTLPPAEFDKIRMQMVFTVNMLFLALLADRDNSSRYTDGTPVVRLMRVVDPGEAEYREIDSEYTSLVEVLGEFTPPEGWSFDIAPMPRIDREEETSFSLTEVAKMLNDPATFPVIDADRSESNRQAGRQVFEEFGNTEPYTPDNDLWAKVPVRLSHDQGSGPVVEIGKFDFSSKSDIAVLKRAIAAWESVQ